MSRVGPGVASAMREFGFRVEDRLRMTPLARRFQAVREKRALTIKDAAFRLKVPQYRLRAVEDGSTRGFDADLFWKYVEFLDLSDWVSEWAEANRTFARRLRIASRSRLPSRASGSAREQGSRTKPRGAPSRSAKRGCAQGTQILVLFPLRKD